MIPSELKYAKSHEWASIGDDDIATIGITDFAQEQLGDLVFVELPDVGDTFEAGAEIGSVESVKAASEIYCPVKGEVVEVNEALEEAPEKVNEDPYGEGWMIKVKIAEIPDSLMDADAYEASLEG